MSLASGAVIAALGALLLVDSAGGLHLSLGWMAVVLTGAVGAIFGIKFHVMALFGEHADRLYDYVKQRGGATESRPGSADTAVSAREQRIRDALEDRPPRSPACGESRHTDEHGRGGNSRSGEPRLRR